MVLYLYNFSASNTNGSDTRLRNEFIWIDRISCGRFCWYNASASGVNFTKDVYRMCRRCFQRNIGRDMGSLSRTSVCRMQQWYMKNTNYFFLFQAVNKTSPKYSIWHTKTKAYPKVCSLKRDLHSNIKINWNTFKYFVIGEIVQSMRIVSEEAPLEQTVFVPLDNLTNNVPVVFLLKILYEFLPGFILDCYLKLVKSKKRFAVNAL